MPKCQNAFPVCIRLYGYGDHCFTCVNDSETYIADRWNLIFTVLLESRWSCFPREFKVKYQTVMTVKSKSIANSMTIIDGEPHLDIRYFFIMGHGICHNKTQAFSALCPKDSPNSKGESTEPSLISVMFRCKICVSTLWSRYN